MPGLDPGIHDSFCTAKTWMAGDAARPRQVSVTVKISGALGGLRLGHAERMEIGVEHRLLLTPLVLVLLADADHCA